MLVKPSRVCCCLWYIVLQVVMVLFRAIPEYVLGFTIYSQTLRNRYTMPKPRNESCPTGGPGSTFVIRTPHGCPRHMNDNLTLSTISIRVFFTGTGTIWCQWSSHEGYGSNRLVINHIYTPKCESYAYLGCILTWCCWATLLKFHEHKNWWN